MRIAKLAIVCALSALGLFGQAGTGTITGTVTDAAGAVVPGAAIEVRNADTNVAYPTVTTETGAYTVLRLPPGGYAITVTASGFKTMSSSSWMKNSVSQLVIIC